MRLRSLVKNKVMLMLVDSGSSHSFISSAFLEKVGITPQPAQPRKVRVANGDMLFTDKCVPNLEWWIQGQSFCMNMMVLDMGFYDCILGYDWLQQHSPINHHWKHRTMEFVYQAKTFS